MLFARPVDDGALLEALLLERLSPPVHPFNAVEWDITIAPA